MLKGKTLKCHKSFGSLHRACLAKRNNTPVFCFFFFPRLLEGRVIWKGSFSTGPARLQNRVMPGPPCGASTSRAPGFEVARFFTVVSEVSGAMGFPAGLAPVVPWAGFPPQQAKGSGSAPPPAHPGPFVARGAEASLSSGLLLRLVFLIGQACLI